MSHFTRTPQRIRQGGQVAGPRWRSATILGGVGVAAVALTAAMAGLAHYPGS